MATFLNIDLNKPIHWKFLIKHLLFSLIWLLGFSIFIFRVDLIFYDYFSIRFLWINKMIPFFYIGIVLVVMFFSKWYYNVALIFYPLLVIFWFLPKLILAKGKIYLFSNYISSVINFFKKFKRSIIHLLLFVITGFLLFITDSDIIRILSILIFTYFYYRFVINYVKKSLNPPRLFGADIDKTIEDIIVSPEKGMFLVKTIEDQKIDEKLTEDVIKMKRLERLILLNFFILTFKDNLNGFNGKKAFVISWIYQLIGLFIITLTFYSFVNFELYIVDKMNFTIIGKPNVFDFFYYTIKTITFGNINNIVPLSIIARIVEIMSFLTLGIFLLIIVTSIIFSLRQDRISENIKKATELCVMQNQLIAEHIRIKYQTDIQTVLNESSNIKTSITNLKNVIEKLF
jgi:hypothetical protein